MTDHSKTHKMHLITTTAETAIDEQVTSNTKIFTRELFMWKRLLVPNLPPFQVWFAIFVGQWKLPGVSSAFVPIRPSRHAPRGNTELKEIAMSCQPYLALAETGLFVRQFCRCWQNLRYLVPHFDINFPLSQQVLFSTARCSSWTRVLSRIQSNPIQSTYSFWMF